MNHIRRIAAVLAVLFCGWLGMAVAVPAAFATEDPPAGGGGPTGVVPVQVHVVLVGGMPGWQIVLIAAGAAVLAATAAVLMYRAWVTHRRSATTIA